VSDDLTIPRPVYGGARRNRSRIEPGTRRLLMIAGALAAGLVVVLGASSVMRRHTGEIPVVQADNRPIRIKPENPGGLQVANANNEIFLGADGGGGSKLGPEAELPDPKALRAPPAASVSPAGMNQGSQAALSTDGKPVRPAPPTADTSAAKSAPSPAAKPATTAAPASIPDKRPATPPAQPATAEKHPAPPATAGKGAAVQLAALGSEDAAKAEWQTLTKRMPDVLNGRQPSFSKVERDGRTFWRVRTSGFADVAQAKSFCERVRTKGGGCSVADF
jgi:hypothetical protein